jgi:hypothetical protein
MERPHKTGNPRDGSGVVRKSKALGRRRVTLVIIHLENVQNTVD